MDRIKRVISEIFDIDASDISIETTPDDVEAWDSLGQMALVVGLEKEFGITIEYEDVFRILTVGDIYGVLKDKGIDEIP